MDILGVRIDEVTLLSAKEKMLSLLLGDKKCFICTPNSEMIYFAEKNLWFKEILNKSELNVPDGIGVIYASRILKNPLPERVPGFDLTLEVLKECPQKGIRVFLLGSAPGVAEEAKKELEEKYKGINITGTMDGYFKEDAAVINEINSCGADFLLVCLGFPKQEKWINENLEKLNVKVAIGLGGTLDGISGRVPRSPEFFIKHNLEWLHRLLKQPKRFIRMLALPKFILTVIFKR